MENREVINNDQWFLKWIYERMINVHGEKDLYDYMINFKSIIDRSGSVAAPKEERTCPKCGSGKVIMFTSDDDLCKSCGATFPGVLNGSSELASLRQQLKEREESIKELLPIAQWGFDLLVPFDKKGMGKEWPKSISRAKALLDKPI